MQEEITRLVQGLDDSALRFIEACVRHERETRNAPQVPPPSMPHPGGQFTVPENVRHLTSNSSMPPRRFLIGTRRPSPRRKAVQGDGSGWSFCSSATARCVSAKCCPSTTARI
ncbi:MAG: hypothetical protein ACLUPV_00150 [Bilophila wadsworthia]